MIALARSLSRRWISVTLLGEAGEEGGLLDRRVATADDRDVLVAEEEAVTGGTGRDAVGEAGAPHPALRACATASPVATITVLARHGAIVATDDLGVGLEVDLDHVVGHQLGAEALGLAAHLIHELGALDPLGETGEVLHLGGLT